MSVVQGLSLSFNENLLRLQLYSGVFAVLLSMVHVQLVHGNSMNHLYPPKKPSSEIYNLSPKDFYDQYLTSYITTLNTTKTKHILSEVLHDGTKLSYPDKWDWRDKKIISSVKNQKKCGACWAFATAETIESVYTMYHNVTSVPELSVQEIIDCSEYTKGCSGGNTCEALLWLKQTSVPLVSDTVYPLTDESDSCKVERSGTEGLIVKAYQCLDPLKNESDIPYLIYRYGPLIAGVDASTWNEYLGGIIKYHCGTKLNHAVQIVGYDFTGKVPYYIIRNSWGTDWGHDGYVYLRYGGNTCGITQSINVIFNVGQGSLP